MVSFCSALQRSSADVSRAGRLVMRKGCGANVRRKRRMHAQRMQGRRSPQPDKRNRRPRTHGRRPQAAELLDNGGQRDRPPRKGPEWSIETGSLLRTRNWIASRRRRATPSRSGRGTKAGIATRCVQPISECRSPSLCISVRLITDLDAASTILPRLTKVGVKSARCRESQISQFHTKLHTKERRDDQPASV